MKKKSFLTKRVTWPHILTFLGVVASIASAVYLQSIYAKVIAFETLYKRAMQGADLTSESLYSFRFHLEAFVVFGAIIGLFYIVLMTIIAIFQRASFARTNLRFEQHGASIVFTFTEKKKLMPGFFLLAEVWLRPDSVGAQKLPYYSRPIGTLVGNTVTVSLRDLPTGKYVVDRVDYAIHDYLGVIAALFSKEEEGMEVLLSRATTLNIPSPQQFEVLIDGMKSVASTEANESYFSTREYRSGDPLKRIHWKHTAKKQKFIVRTPEDRTTNLDEIDVVLNMYHPFGNRVEQSKEIGEYIEKFFGFLKTLSEKQYKSVTLHINGGAGQEIREVNNFNPDKLKAFILRHLVSQTKTKLTEFITERRLEEAFIFTHQLDLPPNNCKRVLVAVLMREKTNTFINRATELQHKTFLENAVNWFILPIFSSYLNLESYKRKLTSGIAAIRKEWITV